MSSEDFALNNQDPDDVASGHSFRNRRPTATIGQYSKLATSLERRRANWAEAVTTLPPATPNISVPTQAPAAPTQTQDSSSPGQSMPLEISSYTGAINLPLINNPQNGLYPGFSDPASYGNWDAAIAQNMLYTMQDQYCFPGGADILAAPIAAMPSASSSTSSPSEGSTTGLSAPGYATKSVVFSLQEMHRCLLLPSQCWFPANARLAPSPTPSRLLPLAPPSRLLSHSRHLVRRADIFGPGLHDNRTAPVYALIDSESRRREGECSRGPIFGRRHGSTSQKKSRKDPGARSIRSIQVVDPVRAQALETGYGHIRRNVLTDEKITWLEGRESVALMAQEGLDFGYKKLGLNPVDFPSVTEKEQDLVNSYNPSKSFTYMVTQMHDRVWSTRKTAKQAARDIVKGPNGYGFIQLPAAEWVAGPLGSYNQGDTRNCSMMPPSRSTKDPAPSQPPHKPQFRLSQSLYSSVRCAALSASGQVVTGWRKSFLRKIYYSQFVTDLKTFREWQEYTSNSTVLTGHGPTRTVPPSFLARKFQESITEKARMKIFKDIVAPIPSAEVMETFDFALNQ
ncbi:hypothetical protein B0H14DRAFT_3168629 [Mycena olivaceomarginata]|nr:hypothetical protein B0H14DRAFT_3168629 [Mycena olivaceomarginata]